MAVDIRRLPVADLRRYSQAKGRSPCDRPFALPKGLLRGNDCGLGATVAEHLTLISARSRLRRFFATPLHEIIPS